MLGEGTTYDISGSVSTAEKKFSINFSETRTKFCLSLLFNGSNSYLFVTGIEIYKFKADNKNVQLSNSVLFKKSDKFGATESREVSFKWKCV